MKLRPILAALAVLPSLLAGAFVALPAHAQINAGLNQVGAATGLSATDPRVIAARLINVALGTLGIILLTIILYAGFLWMTAGGDSAKVDKAKAWIRNAVIGLVIILLSWAIAYFVINALLNATGQGTGGVTGTGPGGGVLPGGGTGNFFHLSGRSPTGDQKQADVVIRLTFSDKIEASSLVTLKVEPTANGSWQLNKYDSKVAEFHASNPCPGFPNKNTCFIYDTSYKVTVPDTFKSANKEVIHCGGLYPCTFTFKSGHDVDAQAPNVNINTLWEGKSVSVDWAVDVTAQATDDNGISVMQWFEADQLFAPDGTEAPPGPTTDFTATRYWDTTGLPLKSTHQITVKSTDLDDNVGFKSVNVTILAAHCFNDKQDIDESGKDCGGKDCLACPGGACVKDADCASNKCVNGVCVEQPIITDVKPIAGKKGTYVSIWGYNFGDTGTVSFMGPPEVTAKAPQACVNLGAKTWTNNFVLVELPDGAATGPIRLVNANSNLEDTTKDDFGPKFTFKVNNQDVPGVCSVVPDAGKPGDQAALKGTGFGSSKGSVGFGNSSITQNLSWLTDVGFSVPVMNPGLYPVWIKHANGLESNKVPYAIQNPQQLQPAPVITTIDPTSGPRGEYITIIGQRFGNEPNLVWFHDSATGIEVQADTAFPSGCGKDWWRDTSIIVKVPEAASKIANFKMPAKFTVYVVRKDSVRNVKPDADFQYIDAQAKPGICSVNPTSGPAKTAPITIIGERFGTSGPGSSVKFYDEQVAPTTGWQNGQILATVPDNAKTGPLTVEVDAKKSNPFQFKVADCRVDAKVCDKNQICCGDGSCASGLCPVESFTAMYAWQFSTGVIPKAPSVIEACDTSGQGRQPPTPTPWMHQQGGDQVCINPKPVMGILFDMEIDGSANLNNLFTLKECVGTGADPCGTMTKVNIINLTKTDIINNGIKQSYVTFKPANILKANTFYYVLLSQDIRSADVKYGDHMTEKKSCPEEKLGYCYQFHTRVDAGNCQVGGVYVEPWKATVQGGEAKNYDALPTAKGAVCNLLDCEDINFDWSTDPITKAQVQTPADPTKIHACHQTVLAGMQEAAIPPVTVKSAVSADTTIFGTGDLTIKFITPQIVDKFPECNTACIDILLFAQFNTSLDKSSISNNTVKLLRCDNENCLPAAQHEVPIAVKVDQASLLSQYQNKTQYIDSFVEIDPSVLLKGTYYIVRFKGGDPFMSVKSKYGVLLPKPVEWRFRTRLTNEICKPDHVTVTPARKIEEKIGDRSLFTATVFSAPDECRAEGQMLRANQAFGWDFPADPNRQIAKFAHPYENGIDADGVLPDGCSLDCKAAGSNGVFGAVAQCGNSLVETTDDLYCVNGKTPSMQDCAILPMVSGAGEQCDGGQYCDTDTCLWLPVTKYPQGTCGNGLVDKDKGETCDPGIRCNGIAPISTSAFLNGTPCANQNDYNICLKAGGVCDIYGYLGCSNECHHMGASSVQGTTCGEGTIGLGEDCDQGNNNGKGGCSFDCLHVGSKKGIGSVCGNGKLEPGETCEADRAGDAMPLFCDRMTCRKKGLAACAQPGDSNCCGNNNNNELGKECDDGKHKDGDGCSQICLLEGSSYGYQTPSFCGDGILGTGEACEVGLSSDKFAQGIIAASGSGNGKADNKTLVEAVGQGVPDQNKEIKTNLQASYVDVKGTAEYGVMCGHTSEAECPTVQGVRYGLDDYGCCALRPVLADRYPSGAGVNNQGFCRNVLIKATFDRTTPMKVQSVIGNFLIAKQLKNNAAICPEGTSELTYDTAPPNGFLNWLAYGWRKFRSWIKGEPAMAVWCTQMVSGNLQNKGGTSTTEFVYRLEAPLDATSTYIVRFMGDKVFADNGASTANKLGIKTERGVVAVPDTGTNIDDPGSYSWWFYTGEDVCHINSVTVTDKDAEHPGFFRKANEAHLFESMAVALHNGIPEELSQTNVYSWKWLSWVVNDPTIAIHAENMASMDDSTFNSVILALSKNGSAMVIASLKILTDAISQGKSTKDMIVEGALPITVFICDNPWPSTLPFAPFADIGDSSLFRDKDGNYLPGYSAVSAYYYFQTMYCRDKSEGVLPGLQPFLVAPTTADAESGMLRQYLFTFTDPQYMRDGIGIRLYSNPYHDTPLEWYRRRGFLGRPTPIKADGYEAVDDGNTVYASFPNTKGLSENIYQNILIISHNPDASAMTKDIFEQMLKNLVFNINFSFDNTNVCVKDQAGNQGVTVGETFVSPADGITQPIACVSDLDCLKYKTDLRCASFKYKLRHDLQRLNDFKSMTGSMESYKSANGYYPKLSEGTFLPGRTNSRWPSWSETLSAAVGEAMPLDPVNRFISCGLCQDKTGDNKTQVPCAVDADCPAETPVCTSLVGTDPNLVGTDPKTCWNTAKREFTCPYMNDMGETPSTNYPADSWLQPFAPSRFYSYKAIDGGRRFEIGANFEVPPVKFDANGNPANWWYPSYPKEMRQCYTSSTASNNRMCSNDSDCKNCINPSDPKCTAPVQANSCKSVGYRWLFKNICNNETVGEAGVCGDGVLQGSEICELGDTKIASCNYTKPDDGFKLQVCDNCTGWVDDPNLSVCRAKLECGNGRVDGACKDGALKDFACTKNDDCKASDGPHDCTILETCDDGVLNGSYGKCNKTCTGYDKFCGDNKLNPGEDCDNGADNNAYCKRSGDQCTNLSISYSDTCGLGCKGHAPYCGNATTDAPDEQCDGNVLTTTSALCAAGANVEQFCKTNVDCPGYAGFHICPSASESFQVCGGCIGDPGETHQSCVGVQIPRCTTGAMICAPQGVADAIASNKGYFSFGNSSLNLPAPDAYKSCVTDVGCATGQRCIALNQGINCDVNQNDPNTKTSPQCSTYGASYKDNRLGTCRVYDTEHERDCTDQCQWQPKWSVCKLAHACGDGVVDEGEECDEGANNAYFNSCLPSCRKNTCGDGYTLLNVEECDNGPDNGKPVCSAQYGSTCNDCSDQCKVMARSGGYCGDNRVDQGEECDGNVKVQAKAFTPNNDYVSSTWIGPSITDPAVVAVRDYLGAMCDKPPCQIMGERDLGCDTKSKPGCDAIKESTLTCQQLGYDFAINDAFNRAIHVWDWTKARGFKLPEEMINISLMSYESVDLLSNAGQNLWMNRLMTSCGMMGVDIKSMNCTDWCAYKGDLMCSCAGPHSIFHFYWKPVDEWPSKFEFRRCVNLRGSANGFGMVGTSNTKPSCSTSCKPAGCGRCAEEPGDGKIHGYIFDRVWLQVVPNARVTLQYNGINVDQVMTDMNGRFDFSNLNTREECGKYRLVIDKNDDNPCTDSKVARDQLGPDTCLRDITADFGMAVNEGQRGGYWPFTTDEFSVNSYAWTEMLGLIHIYPRPAKGEGYISYGRPTWLDSASWNNIKECQKNPVITNPACWSDPVECQKNMVSTNPACKNELSPRMPWWPMWEPHVIWPSNQARFDPVLSSGNTVGGSQAYALCDYSKRGIIGTNVCARDYNWINQGTLDFANPPYTGLVCPRLRWDWDTKCPLEGSGNCSYQCQNQLNAWRLLPEWGISLKPTKAACDNFCKYNSSDPPNSVCSTKDWTSDLQACHVAINSAQVTAYFRYGDPNNLGKALPDLVDPIELYFAGPEYDPMFDTSVFTINKTQPPAGVASWREYWAKTKTKVYVTTDKGIYTISPQAGDYTIDDFKKPFWHIASISPIGTVTVQNQWQGRKDLPQGENGPQPDSSSSLNTHSSSLRPQGMACWNYYGSICRYEDKNNTLMPVLDYCTEPNQTGAEGIVTFRPVLTPTGLLSKPKCADYGLGWKNGNSVESFNQVNW